MEEKVKYLLLSLIIFTASCSTSEKTVTQEETPKPNILWIMLEDWGYQLSCYGEPGISTPNVDQLAAEGARYTNSFCTAPVCSPSRSAMMTGFHQHFVGAEQHRTAAKFGLPKQDLPEGIKPITAHLKEAGYHTALMQSAKTDLNFIHGEDLFDSRDWKNREEGQPFFAQATFQWTHRKWRRDSIAPISTEDVVVPPYYPQTDLVKRDWANGLEAMQLVDRQVGKLLKRLDDEGLTENTIVFLIGDNGRCMPRGKQFLYDGGMQVPIIVRWPGKVEKATVLEDLASTLDISKTILDLAGVTPDVPLHGRNLLDGSIKDREFVFAARDKMDSTYDAMRAIRSKEYKLIHNLMPERPYLQLNKYKERSYPTLAEMNVLFMKGELNADQQKFMASVKPEFELYDMINDPYELNNLADDPAYKEIKESYLQKLNAWRQSVNDEGVSEDFRKGGWPADFPTRTLEDWEAHLEGFKPWVYREPNSKMKHPYSKW
ncbi:MAG: sulfatase [Ekhidna sp.]|nr:sulfatase [Ekhidna sp.]